MTTHNTGEVDYFPERIYAPTIPSIGVSLGIDRNGQFVNLYHSPVVSCIGVVGRVGSGKSVVLQSIVEQLSRSEAEVIYAAFKGVQSEVRKGVPNVVFVADNAADAITAIEHTARVADERRKKKDTSIHCVVLVRDGINRFVHDPVFEDPSLWEKVCTDIDFIIEYGGVVNVSIIMAGQRLGKLPTRLDVERNEVFSSLIITGSPESTDDLPGTYGDTIDMVGTHLPIGRAHYCTIRGAVQFQAFMPNPSQDTSDREFRVHPRLTKRLVADNDL